jgi:hypothetical protein
MENTTDYEYLLQESYANLALGCTMLVIIVGVIGVIGNISIITFYFFPIKERGERYFIPLLAFVDLLACVVSFVYIFMDSTFYYNYPSEIACRIHCMMQLFLPGISALVFLLISVQRYLLICKPFGPKMTLRWKQMSFALACGLAMLGTSPILGISGILNSEETFMNANVTVHMCKFSVVSSIGTAVYFGFILFTMIVCIIATISLYIPVLKKLNISVKSFRSAISNNACSESENACSKSTAMKTEQIELKAIATSDASQIPLSSPDASQSQQTNYRNPENVCDDHPSNSTFPIEQDNAKDKIQNSKRRKRPKRETVQRRLTMMFFLLILVFIISYIPPLVLLILAYTIENFKFIKLSKTIAMVWIYVRNVVLFNHVINPLIYAYYDLHFRKEMVSCFKRRINYIIKKSKV